MAIWKSTTELELLTEIKETLKQIEINTREKKD